ncbi:MAG TPA: class I SAM-dependent methyltransferase [Afifellaceae bacterium]|nr:class I SAM-dependent methyltransferase [Afifellaceae bacterium]
MQRERDGDDMAVTALERWTGRLDFAARQSARVAWYAGHGLVMRRMVNRIDAKHDENGTERAQIVPPSRPVPSMRRLLSDVAGLLARDLANAEAGFYPLPHDDAGGLPALLAQSRAFFRDVPEVARRRREQSHQEVRCEAKDAAGLPRYYMQNFHYQSGGWLTEESARIYDMQVEVLFSGAASAMRRQALVPIYRHICGRNQRDICFADIATGTGTFLTQLRRAFPRLKITAVDLSEAYLAKTMHRQSNSHFVTPLVGKAEALPIADDALDIATAIFLFHELPPKIRRQAVRELARTIRPGGLFVLVDTLQPGDEPDYDGLLELFPQLFHEPYYGGYLREDLESLFGSAGFRLESASNAFFSRITSFRRL